MSKCRHCTDSFNRFLHLEQHLSQVEDAPSLVVGQRVTARRSCGLVCGKDEPGVVVEEYQLNGRPGWTLVFRDGGHDGWSPCEVGLYMRIGKVCESLTGYQYAGSLRVYEDWRRGVFNAAWAAEEGD